MNKKPAVVAKAARKPRTVKLSRSELEMAKHFGVSPEEVAKKKLPKRGRPTGSKNKTKTGFDYFVEGYREQKAKEEFQTALVDWEKLCKRLQEALAKEMKEADALREELSRKRTLFERLVCLTTGSV